MIILSQQQLEEHLGMAWWSGNDYDNFAADFAGKGEARDICVHDSLHYLKQQKVPTDLFNALVTRITQMAIDGRMHDCEDQAHSILQVLGLEAAK